MGMTAARSASAPTTWSRVRRWRSSCRPRASPSEPCPGPIDVLATLVLLWAANIVAVLATANSDDALLSTAMLLATVLALVVLPTTLETLTRGRSLGKLALGLRTVRDDAGRPSASGTRSPARSSGVVEIWLLFGDPRARQRPGQPAGQAPRRLAAGTYVVRERV